jgi:glycosyltransferase involved in cell wall biosynthesis
MEKKIRIAVTYRACMGWRIPIFERLAACDDITLKVFHGESIPNTKLINPKNFGNLQHEELKTYSMTVKSTGREVPLVFNPGIVKALKRYEPDVLLCEGGSNILNNLLIYRWAKKAGIPTIWWCLGYIPGRKYRGISKVYQAFRKRLMRQSTALLGYSSRALRYFEEMDLGRPLFKAVNCVDTDRVFQRIEKAKEAPVDIRAQLGIGNKKLLLFVGALEPPKDIDKLLEAYKRLKTYRNDLALVIVGDGTVRQDLENMAKDLDLDVHFVGNVIEGVSHYFLAADLFVLPGLGGLAISDAMAHGLPVICSVADGCEEDLVRNGENGYILPDGSVEQLVQNIDHVLSSPQLAEMGVASQRIIREEVNVNTYLQGILDVVRYAYTQKK